MDLEFLMKRAQIAAPCSESWDEMTGDEKSRLCAKCNLHVHNAAAMTDEEVLSRIMMAAAGKEVCMRLYLRADGTFLTKNCPVGLRKLKQQARQAASWFAGGVSIVLSMAANALPGLSQTCQHSKGKPVWHSTIKAEGSGAVGKNSQPAPQPQGYIRINNQPVPGRIALPSYTPADVEQQQERLAALEKAGKADTREFADVLSHMAFMQFRLGNYQLADLNYQRAFKIYETCRDRKSAHACALQLHASAQIRNDAAQQQKWRKIADDLAGLPPPPKGLVQSPITDPQNPYYTRNQQ